ncbi:MAG: hypothetical protein INQ03_13600 [Candidatus Heimdallarchaeota archaeon]|nr:hypothetical protein [Candidatus Heimdallarchaeota archaeon]
MAYFCIRCNKDFTFEGTESEGLCLSCKADVEFAEVSIDDIINENDFPILVVDPDGKVVTANIITLGYLQKTKDEIVQVPGGNVIQCIHSEEPEGCGNTIHCSGCAIRNSVMKTFSTQKPVFGIEAYQYLRMEDGEVQKMKITLTTELVGNLVFLRLDKVEQIN